jgi:hypothetical protein
MDVEPALALHFYGVERETMILTTKRSLSFSILILDRREMRRFASTYYKAPVTKLLARVVLKVKQLPYGIMLHLTSFTASRLVRSRAVQAP